LEIKTLKEETKKKKGKKYRDLSKGVECQESSSEAKTRRDRTSNKTQVREI